MEFSPDYKKMASTRLSPEERQSAFNAMLINAAAIDCGTIVDPNIKQAEFGESLAANLAMVKRFSPAETKIYRALLSDYLRFCRMYIRGSETDDAVFDRHVYKAIIRAIRVAYERGSKEAPLI